MRNSIVIAVVLALFGTHAVTPETARAAIVTPYAMTGSQPVVDGVTHEWGTSGSEFIPRVTEEEPDPQPEYATQHVNIVRMDADARDVRFELSLPSDGTRLSGQVNARQRTTNQALRESRPNHRVVAAINGDFWRTRENQYSPISLNIRNGELVAAAPGVRNAIGFMTDGSPNIGGANISMTMTLPGLEPFEFGGVNQARDPDEVIVYTPTWGVRTRTSEPGTEVVLSGVSLPLTVGGTFAGSVRSVAANVTNTTIPADAVVLSATGRFAEELAALALGDPVEFTVSLDAPWPDVVNAVGGLRIVVHDGVPTTDFSRPNDFVRDARISAGITAAGDVILVTLGTLSDGTDGLIQADMAQLMASLGAVEAITLDGGGSATMAVDPAGDTPFGLANQPIAGYERRVNTTLQLVYTAPEPEPMGPTVTAPIMRFSASTTAGKTDAAVDISWQAADADGSVVATELQRLVEGVWQPVPLPTPTTTTINRRLKFSRDFKYRVRATDDDGNVTDWAVGRTYRIGAVNERAAAIVRTGRWPIVDRTSAIGGKVGRNSAKTKPGQTASLTFSAIQVAWVGPRSDTSGTAHLELDGLSAGSVSLTRTKALARAVVFIAPALDETSVTIAPSRTIKLTNVSTLARPYVDLDAFLLLTAR